MTRAARSRANPSNSSNTAPAVDQISLNANHTISLKPILMGNATAADGTVLNLQDPDSLSTDGKGDLVLVSQGDSEIITIADRETKPTPAADLAPGR